MTFVQPTPIDGLLADLGTMARRGKAGTLSPVEFALSASRLKGALAASDCDPLGLIEGDLDHLIEAATSDTLTRGQFAEITGRMRVRLLERRSEPMPVVAAFPTLPTGVRAQRLGLTLHSGGLDRRPHPPAKGA